ncbi:MAG: hypothetical protein KDC67_08630, partial [Ignavibacteriae bacterium]|nr:hypothetical protein [Ignavibacteriota bacterium]
MKKTYLFKTLMLLFVLSSCSNEPFETDNINSEINYDLFKGQLVEGVLHFENKDEFKTSIDFIKSLDDGAVEDFMYGFYEEGFEPSFPFYKENDDERISKFVAEKLRRRGGAN